MPSIGSKFRLESVWQDVRYTARIMRRSPGFAFAAITTFALGIGANTAIFSIVDAAVLRPLPYPASDRLVTFTLHNLQGGRSTTSAIPRDLLDWRERSDLFEQMAGTGGGLVTLASEREPEELRVARVTSGFFELFRTTPRLGRFFGRDDEVPGNGRAAVLGHGFWKTRFGGSPDVVGTKLYLNGEPYDIVGVTREDFRYPPHSARQTPVFLPFTFTDKDRAYGVVQSTTAAPIARLRDGISVQQAEAGMAQMLAAADVRKVGFNKGYLRAEAVPLIETYVGRARSWMLMLLGAVAFVLLIACANVANLMLAHGATRARELTVRSAIGASRRRIVRQLIAESMVLALAGAAVGLAVAWIGLGTLRAAVPPSVPRAFAIGLDLRVLGFTAIVALATGLVCGVLPAFHGSRVDLIGGLKAGAGHGATAGRGANRLRQALVWAEVAFAVMLLVGAGLFISSFVRMVRVDLGFDPSGITSLRYTLPRPAGATPVSVNVLHRMLEAVRAVPGVEAGIVVGGSGPLQGGWSSFPLRVIGRPIKAGEDIRYRHVSDGFIELLRVPVLRGRALTEEDRTGPPVAVINDKAARQFWGAENPLDARLEINKTVYEIVGVVGDMRYASPTSAAVPEAFLHYSQATPRIGTFVFRSAAPPAALLPAVKNAIWSVLPGQPIADVQTSDELFSNATAAGRFNTMMMSIFGALALVIAATGVYGIIAFVVHQRTREIGVRLALGARPADVVRMFLSEGTAVVMLGICAGLAAAWWMARSLETFLFEVQPRDPVVFIGVACCLAAVGVLACWLPARRAARVNPLAALRAE